MNITQSSFFWRALRRTASVVTVLVALAAPVAAHAQGTIAGRVVETGSLRPLTSATVAIEGSRLGTSTGADGRYRIANVGEGRYVVVARLLGFTPVRRTVTIANGEQASADFELVPSATVLDQVVVTGTAGGEQRRSIGNSVSTINAGEQLAKSAAPNLSSLLNARAPGVVIAPSTSRLGAGPTVMIRGRSSLSLDNTPLIYIDGVRVTNASGTGPVGLSSAAAGPSFGGQGSQVAGRLNDIRPEDIESIEVIKGPAAATIYGTEAASGVIQIITKKGALGAKPQVTLQVQEGTLEFANAADRVESNYFKDATGAVVTWNGVQQEKDRGTPIFKTGQTRSYIAGLSGSRDQLRYYVSTAYENDLGIEPNNSLRQFSLHANLTAPVATNTDLATSLNFIGLSSHLGADIGASALLGAELGHRLIFPTARGFYPNFAPEIPQQLYDNAQGINRFTGSGTLSNHPVSWFTHRLIAGLDYTGDDSRAIERFAPPNLAVMLAPSGAGGRINQTLRHNTLITADYAGTAKFDLSSALSSATSIGGQFYRTELNTTAVGGYGFPAPGVETVSAAANSVLPTQTQTLNTTIGAYGQETIGWRERLYVTGAVRVDNNSAFGEAFKWVSYPKVSLAWIVSEEPFWRWSHALSVLRLRAAYGESGRQPQAFAALRTFTPIQGPGGTNALTPGNIGNPDLKPERGKEWELGFEGNVLGRLDLDFTYYSKKITDEILQQPVPPSSGFSGNRFANLGRVDNHGYELQATLQAIRTPRIGWDITGNVGTNRDIIKDLGGLPSVIASAGQYNKVGYPIGGIFTKVVVGATRNPTTNLATNVVCYVSETVAPVACAQAPFVFIGTPTPKAIGSVGNTITVGRNLRFYGLVDFKRGHKVFNSIDLFRCTGLIAPPGLCEANYYPERFDPITLAETAGNTLAQGTYDQYYQSGSFAKLRELSVTYTVPGQWLRGTSQASVTLAGRDLHTWTRYKGPDPEVNVVNPATSSTSQDQGVTPPLRRFIATINLVF